MANYNLDENEMEKLNHNTLPTIDLCAFLNSSGKEREKIASYVDEICRSIGFLIIKNHGVPETVRKAAWKTAEDFFAASPDEKKSVKPDDEGSPRGYLPIEGESLARTIGDATPPDRKETSSCGPLSAPIDHTRTDDFHFFYGSNIWPQTPSDFKENWTAYYKAMERLGDQLMQMLATALNVDEDYFVDYHTHHISALRSQNYPSLETKVLPGQLRAGTHSDYGSVTLLYPDPKVSGLEVKSPTGEWIKAPIVEDAYIINIGDLLAHWTNDRWVSTLHRVVEPEGNKGRTSPKRQSIAYFMNPNYDAIIKAIPTCISVDNPAKYEPVLAGNYLMNKFNKSI